MSITYKVLFKFLSFHSHVQVTSPVTDGRTIVTSEHPVSYKNECWYKLMDTSCWHNAKILQKIMQVKESHLSLVVITSLEWLAQYTKKKAHCSFAGEALLWVHSPVENAQIQKEPFHEASLELNKQSFNSVHLHEQLKASYVPYEILLRGNFWKSWPEPRGEN